MKTAALVILSTFLATILIACKPKEPELAPLGADAASLGSGDMKTLDTFIVGTWAVVDPAEGVDPNDYYTFKTGGTFECGDTKYYKSGGKWTVTGNTVSLTYDTMNDKSFEAFRAEYKKAEETGVQMAVSRAIIFDGVYERLARANALWVDEDQKHLTFSDPKATPTAGGGEGDLGGALGNLAKMSKVQLERMGAKKS